MEFDLKALSKNKNFLLILIFSISFCVHLIGINRIGRTWDEQFKVDTGFVAWKNLTKGDFSEKSWSHVYEHPMVGKYIYGFFMGPHMIRIDDGKGHFARLTNLDIQALSTGNYIKTQIGNELYMVSYDLTTPRLVSALLNSLAVTLTVLIAMLFLSELWAFLAGAFLILIPRFLAMGQLITFESVTVFFFTLTAVLFYKLLKNPGEIKWYIVVGILCGLLFWTRYNNYFIFVFLGGWMLLDYYFKKNREIFNLRLLLIPTIAFFLGVIIWPYLWHDFPKNLIESFMFHSGRATPTLYFLNRILVTTPVPILIGLTLGIIFALKNKKYWQVFILWWFFSVLLVNTLIGSSGGGTRYVFIIYPVIGMLCAYGFSQLLKRKWIYALIPVFAYMIIEMAMFYPYYLDYYNMIIGGVRGASKLDYEVSWWGEGQRALGNYANKNIPPGSTFGYFVVPRYVAPATRFDINNLGFIDDTDLTPDYVMVSRWRVNEFNKKHGTKYSVIHSEKVRSEDLVILFKKK